MKSHTSLSSSRLSCERTPRYVSCSIPLPTLMVNLALMIDLGPCLMPLIFDILLHFQTGKIGLVTDMKQAFLQTNIAEEHRDFLRFIWLQEFNSDENVILRFKRTVFGLTCSLFNFIWKSFCRLIGSKNLSKNCYLFIYLFIYLIMI